MKDLRQFGQEEESWYIHTLLLYNKHCLPTTTGPIVLQDILNLEITCINTLSLHLSLSHPSTQHMFGEKVLSTPAFRVWGAEQLPVGSSISMCSYKPEFVKRGLVSSYQSCLCLCLLQFRPLTRSGPLNMTVGRLRLIDRCCDKASHRLCCV